MESTLECAGVALMWCEDRVAVNRHEADAPVPVPGRALTGCSESVKPGRRVAAQVVGRLGNVQFS